MGQSARTPTSIGMRRSDRMKKVSRMCIVLGLMIIFLAVAFIPLVTAFQGNSTDNQPNIISSPTTYQITDSTPTGSSISSTGLVLSTDMQTLRTAKMKNFANTNDGTIYSGVGSHEGVRGYSYGSNSIGFPLLSTKNVNISFGGWYYPAVSPMDRGCTFSTGDNGGGFSWGFGSYTVNNHIYYLCPSGAGWGDTGFIFRAHTWYNVFWTLNYSDSDNTLVKCYVNGTEEYSATIVNCSMPTGGVHICSDGTSGFNGLVDENLMAERVWTPTEIETNYLDSFTKYIPAVPQYIYEPTASEAIVSWGLSTNATWLAQYPENGTLYGNPDPDHSYWVNLTATNLNGVAYQNYTIQVYPQIAVTSSPVTSIINPNAYLYEVTANHTATFAKDTCNASWVTVGADNGTVWGTPPSINDGRPLSYTVSIEVTNALCTPTNGWQNYTLWVYPSVHITSLPLTSVTNPDEYFDTAIANVTCIWSIIAGNASWLSIGESNGTLWGTPPTITDGRPLMFQVVITADNSHSSDVQNWNIWVYPQTLFAPIIIPANVDSVDFFRHVVNEGVYYWLNYSSDQEVIWSLDTNASWLSWSSLTLSGTPGYDQAGYYYADLTATSEGGSATVHIYVHVVDAPYGQSTSLITDVIPVLVGLAIIIPIAGWLGMAMRRKP